MNVHWNNLKLQHPPYSTWRAHQNMFDTKTFLAAIDKMIRELESMDIFNVEATLLSRLIYRMKNKFRSDKGLKSMEKVKRVLISYLNMALVQDYKNLKSYVYVEDKMVTLPSRQLLEYVLVRTQGFAKLMERLEQVARCSAHFLKMRIKLGHAWSISLIALATVSRLWFLSRQLIKQCCIWYKELYQYVDKLRYVGLLWLPKNELLPHDLKQWLSLEWICSDINTHYDNNWEDLVLKLSEKRSVDCVDVSRTFAEFGAITHTLSNSSQQDISTPDISNNLYVPYADINDIGEPINREIFEANCPKVYESDTGTLLAKKRKCSHNDSVEEKRWKNPNLKGKRKKRKKGRPKN